jgi:MinD-like ATPase involved in chromosome partitioning or flagellar assembly
MAKTIGIIAIKGGVGKTTIAASLATDLANHYRKKVLLVDANYSAPNLGLHMDIVQPIKTIHEVLDKKAKIQKAIHNKYGVDVIPGSYIYNKALNPLKLKDKLRKVKHSYDFVIIDSSPTLNNEILSTILASDSLFVVTTPDYPTISCSMRAANIALQKGKPIRGIIINKIRNPLYEISLKEIEEATSIPVVAKIPDDKKAIKSLFTRIPLSIYSRKSSFSKEINRLNAAITGHKEKIPFHKRIFPKNFRREQVNRQLLKESFYTPKFS